MNPTDDVLRRLAYLAGGLILATGLVVGVLLATGGETASVSGRFIQQGCGVLAGNCASKPIRGEVTLTAENGGTYKVMTDAVGGWTIGVPPGVYTVTARNPRWWPPSARCYHGTPVRVRQGHRITGILVVCVLQ